MVEEIQEEVSEESNGPLSEEKKVNHGPFAQENVIPIVQSEVVESEVQLSRNIMSLFSRVCVDVKRIVDFDKKVIRFVFVDAPYPEALNEDTTKANLIGEEEVAYVRMQLDHISHGVRFASDYGLFLPYIMEQVAQYHSFVVVSRARRMIAAKLSRTSVHMVEPKGSEWLLQDDSKGQPPKSKEGIEIFGHTLPGVGKMNSGGSQNDARAI